LPVHFKRGRRTARTNQNRPARRESDSFTKRWGALGMLPETDLNSFKGRGTPDRTYASTGPDGKKDGVWGSNHPLKAKRSGVANWENTEEGKSGTGPA